MTIVEAIKTVLKDTPEGLTAKEIYQAVVEAGLYEFGAKDPIGVVNGQIRRRCMDLDFPTAYPIKVFRISGQQGKKNKYALYIDKAAPVGSRPAVGKKTSDGLLPEEKINTAVQEHLASIRQQLLESILEQEPRFFEHLVVILLLKMGYGPDDQSGTVTRASHDSGIDGIISEDRLGLGLIYLQAKRYAPHNTVGRRAVQEFVGAMEHVNKGIFITTSSFTDKALAYAEKQQQKSIKLIDGQLLSELLVKYEVGVNVAQTVSIYRIDSDYFNTGS